MNYFKGIVSLVPLLIYNNQMKAIKKDMDGLFWSVKGVGPSYKGSINKMIYFHYYICAVKFTLHICIILGLIPYSGINYNTTLVYSIYKMQYYNIPLVWKTAFNVFSLLVIFIMIYPIVNIGLVALYFTTRIYIQTLLLCDFIENIGKKEEYEMKFCLLDDENYQRDVYNRLKFAIDHILKIKMLYFIKKKRTKIYVFVLGSLVELLHCFL